VLVPGFENSSILDLGNELAELNTANLKRARDYFYSTLFFGEIQYSDVIEGNYNDFDLVHHGRGQLLFDFAKFLNCVRYGLIDIPEARSALFIGCGSGRLLSSFVLLLEAVGITKITFNDYLDTHIKLSKDSLEHNLSKEQKDRIYSKIDIQWVGGDCTKVDLGSKYDFIFAQWYVTSEIFELGSQETILSSRINLSQRLSSLLTPGGIFFEEVPDVDSLNTFYAIGRKKTEQLMEEVGLRSLCGREVSNLLLSYFGSCEGSKDSNLPFHIRYTPTIANMKKERAISSLTLRRILYRGPILGTSAEHETEDILIRLVSEWALKQNILTAPGALGQKFQEMLYLLQLQNNNFLYPKWQVMLAWRL